MDGIFIAFVFFLSLYVAWSDSPAKALVNVYLPILLLTPSEDSFKLVEGIPAITINQAAIIPIFALAFISRYGLSIINLILSVSWMDVLVAIFIFTATLSELINEGYKEAQNNTYSDTFNILIPYLTAKILIESNKLDFKFAKRFVQLAALCSFGLLYEFLSGKNLFVQIFWHIFHVSNSVTGVFRYSFMRATGPYTHPIIACIIMCIAFFLHSWLMLNKKSEKKFFGLSFDRILYIPLLVGMLTPLSRGPLLGAFCGFFIFSFAIKKTYMLAIRIFVIGMVIFSYLYIHNIKEEVQLEGDQDLSGTVYYRSRLLDVYIEDYYKSPYIGEGKLNLEFKQGLNSIDNAYLYLALIHGAINVIFFILIMLTFFIRLLMKLRITMPVSERQLVLTFLSLIVMYVISFGTVWVSADMMTILFLLFGWMEGYLSTKSKPQFVI